MGRYHSITVSQKIDSNHAYEKLVAKLSEYGGKGYKYRSHKIIESDTVYKQHSWFEFGIGPKESRYPGDVVSIDLELDKKSGKKYEFSSGEERNLGDWRFLFTEKILIYHYRSKNGTGNIAETKREIEIHLSQKVEDKKLHSELIENHLLEYLNENVDDVHVKKKEFTLAEIGQFVDKFLSESSKLDVNDHEGIMLRIDSNDLKDSVEFWAEGSGGTRKHVWYSIHFQWNGVVAFESKSYATPTKKFVVNLFTRFIESRRRCSHLLNFKESL